jgi:hypothetical protein
VTIRSKVARYRAPLAPRPATPEEERRAAERMRRGALEDRLWCAEREVSEFHRLVETYLPDCPREEGLADTDGGNAAHLMNRVIEAGETIERLRAELHEAVDNRDRHAADLEELRRLMAVEDGLRRAEIAKALGDAEAAVAAGLEVGR